MLARVQAQGFEGGWLGCWHWKSRLRAEVAAGFATDHGGTLSPGVRTAAIRAERQYGFRMAGGKEISL
jgi:hypothetical protein